VKVAGTYHTSPAKLYVFQNPVYIEGRDAVIHTIDMHQQQQQQASIFLQSHGCYIPIFRQFSLSPRSPKKKLVAIDGIAVSITQFSGGEYYHFLTEGLSRLVLSLALLPVDAGVTLIVPKGQPFIREALRMLQEEGSIYADRMKMISRVVEFDGSSMVLQVKQLYIVDWRAAVSAVGASAEDNKKQQAGKQLLPPADALRLLQKVVKKEEENEERDGDEGTRTENLIWISRKEGSSRSVVNENEIIAALAKVAKNHDLKLVVFHGDDELSSLEATRDLFASAASVVGVHGGGLANIIFCQGGGRRRRLSNAVVVVEISLPESELREYEHLSSALDGIDYHSYKLSGASLFETRLMLDADNVGSFVDASLMKG
jgi:hypothetical protein